MVYSEPAQLVNAQVVWDFTYDANGMRTQRTNGTVTYSYVYNGSSLSQMTVGSNTLNFAYDASGTPMAVTYNGTNYYYVTNLQGDVTAILDSSGTSVVTYTYDAWGNILSTDGTMKDSLGQLNPLRYRGYVYDQETELYYLQSRYYDPQVGRFINADAYTSTGQGFLGSNMFAYCLNNPVMGYDPTGCWDWGGVIAGLGIITGTIIVAATVGIATPIGALIAGAAIVTGAATTYAAATDSTMVVDASYSWQVSGNYYVKGGGAITIDFDNDEINCYPHIGGGKGYSSGFSYSAGLVDNYDQAEDYAMHFVDINVGYYVGFDHCWNPLEEHDSATQATSISFSSGASYGVGYDYYFGPIQVACW